jgi:hypothetical protein
MCIAPPGNQSVTDTMTGSRQVGTPPTDNAVSAVLSHLSRQMGSSRRYPPIPFIEDVDERLLDLIRRVIRVRRIP